MATFYLNHESELYHYGIKGMKWGKHNSSADYMAGLKIRRDASRYKTGRVGKPLRTLEYEADITNQRYNNKKQNLASDKQLKDERKSAAKKQHMNREKAAWGNKKADIEYDRMKQRKEYDLRQREIKDRDRREREAEGNRKREEALYRDSKHREYVSDKALEKKNKDYKEATAEQRVANAKSKAERMKVEDAMRRENAAKSARTNAKQQNAANYRAQDRVLAEQEKERRRRKSVKKANERSSVSRNSQYYRGKR